MQAGFLFGWWFSDGLSRLPTAAREGPVTNRVLPDPLMCLHPTGLRGNSMILHTLMNLGLSASATEKKRMVIALVVCSVLSTSTAVVLTSVVSVTAVRIRFHRAHQYYPMITSHEQQYPIITTQDYPRAMRTYSSAHTRKHGLGCTSRPAVYDDHDISVRLTLARLTTVPLRLAIPAKCTTRDYHPPINTTLNNSTVTQTDASALSELLCATHECCIGLNS